jgi:hypothetical protein
MTETKFPALQLFGRGGRFASDRLTKSRIESNFVSHPLIPWERAKLPTLAETFSIYFGGKSSRRQSRRIYPKSS